MAANDSSLRKRKMRPQNARVCIKIFLFYFNVFELSVNIILCARNFTGLLI